MVAAPFRVVLDACVLFPFTVRDTLLRAAAAGFYQLYWSKEILEETRRNLVATDFDKLPDGIEAQSPDDFLCNLFDLDKNAMLAVVRDQAADMKRPPRSLQELFDGLGKTVPDFVRALRAHATADT